MVEMKAAAMINGSKVTSFATTVAVNCRPVEAPTTTVPAGRPHGMSRTGAPASDSAQQPRQRQMDAARGETADDAAGERQGDGERRGGALRHVLEPGYAMHGPIAVVTAARAQIHHQPRAARMRAGARDTELGWTQRKRRRELGHPLHPKSDLSDFG